VADQKPIPESAALNACALTCVPCRKVVTVPAGQVKFAVEGGQIVIRFKCDRCHTIRSVTLRPGVDF